MRARVCLWCGVVYLYYACVVKDESASSGKSDDEDDIIGPKLPIGDVSVFCC